MKILNEIEADVRTITRIVRQRTSLLNMVSFCSLLSGLALTFPCSCNPTLRGEIAQSSALAVTGHQGR
jgi:hypothetical protein